MGGQADTCYIITKQVLTHDLSPHFTMAFNRFVEIGRVAYIAFGNDEGKLCVIVDVVDQNRGLVDGPCTGVKRQVQPFKQLHLTEHVIKIGPSSRSGVVKKSWEAAEVTAKWEASTWAKKIASRQRRALVTDFERFKLIGISDAEDDDDDNDGLPDNEDDDDDGDGIPDDEEDYDGDGLSNDEDDDDDGDGILDDDEDDDGDGLENDEDPDDDGDGILDENDEL